MRHSSESQTQAPLQVSSLRHTYLVINDLIERRAFVEQSAELDYIRVLVGSHVSEVSRERIGGIWVTDICAELIVGPIETKDDGFRLGRSSRFGRSHERAKVWGNWEKGWHDSRYLCALTCTAGEISAW